MDHKNATLNHKIENWTYANTGARTGAVGLLPADIGKIAYQSDSETYWRLTDDSPVTWVQVGGGGGGGSPSTILSIPYEFDDSVVSGSPAAGFLRGNNATFESSTELYLASADMDAIDWSSFFQAWGTTGTAKLLIAGVLDPNIFYVFPFTAYSFTGGHNKFTVTPATYVNLVGSFVLNDPMLLSFLP